MAVVYLAVSFLASLAVSVSVIEAFGSLALGLLAFTVTGTLVLCGVLLAAALREGFESKEMPLYPAE